MVNRDSGNNIGIEYYITEPFNNLSGTIDLPELLGLQRKGFDRRLFQGISIS